MSNESIIETEGLTKVFTVKKTSVEAVTDLSFTAVRGELVAFLGPNGAGTVSYTHLTLPTKA